MGYLNNELMFEDPFEEINRLMDGLNEMLETDPLFNPPRPALTSMERLTHAESFRSTVDELSQLNTRLKEHEDTTPKEGIHDLMTEIDRNKLATYTRMPEMIIQTNDWNPFAVCSACKGMIDIKSYSIKKYTQEPNPDQHKCPCCNTECAKVPLKDKTGKWLRNSECDVLYDIYPLPHERYRRRYHTLQLERKKPWWKFWAVHRAGEGFWEIAHIPHVKPLVTEPVLSHPAEEALINALAKIEDLRDTIRIQSQRIPPLTSSLFPAISASYEPPQSTPTKPKRKRTTKTTR